MANDNRASYARIGFTVCIGTLAILGTLIYLGGMREHVAESIVETYYDKPVSGLSVGSVVNFRGVKIGQVHEIGFVGGKYGVSGAAGERIYIAMSVNHRLLGFGDNDVINADEERQLMKTLVDRGLRATVTSSGITGLSRIEWDFHTDVTPPEKLAWTPRYAYLPSKISLLENFSVSATKVMNQINKMDLNAAWSNVYASVLSLSQATEGVRVMIESRQADAERSFEDLSSAATSLKMLSDELRRNPSLLIRERVVEPLPETRDCVQN